MPTAAQRGAGTGLCCVNHGWEVFTYTLIPFWEQQMEGRRCVRATLKLLCFKKKKVALFQLEKKTGIRTTTDPRPPLASPQFNKVLLCLQWQDKWTLIDWYWLEMYFSDSNGSFPSGHYVCLPPPTPSSLHTSPTLSVLLVLIGSTSPCSYAPWPLIIMCSFPHFASPQICASKRAERWAE